MIISDKRTTANASHVAVRVSLNAVLVSATSTMLLPKTDNYMLFAIAVTYNATGVVSSVVAGTIMRGGSKKDFRFFFR